MNTFEHFLIQPIRKHENPLHNEKIPAMLAAYFTFSRRKIKQIPTAKTLQHSPVLTSIQTFRMSKLQIKSNTNEIKQTTTDREVRATAIQCCKERDGCHIFETTNHLKSRKKCSTAVLPLFSGCKESRRR